MNEFMTTWPILRIVEHNPALKSFYFEATSEVLPGQFVMLWLPGLDEKPFSVSDVDQGLMEITVKAVGPFTQALMGLAEGSRVGIRGPFGTPFIPVENALLVGGGCGVAPVRHLSRVMTRKGLPHRLLLGTRNGTELMFREEYLASDAIIVTDDGSLGDKELIPYRVETLVEALRPSTLCASGPEVVLLLLRDLARKRGLPVQLSFERYMKCGIGICGQCCLDGNGLRICVEGPVLTHEQIDTATDLGLPHRGATGCRVH